MPPVSQNRFYAGGGGRAQRTIAIRLCIRLAKLARADIPASSTPAQVYIDLFSASADQCPLLSDSDRLLRRSEMTRCAISDRCTAANSIVIRSPRRRRPAGPVGRL